MNIDFLTCYISQHLHTFVYHYDQSGTLLNYICCRHDLKEQMSSLPVSDPDASPLLHFLYEKQNKSCPQIYLDSRHICYSIISNMTHTFIIGPFLLSDHPSSNFLLPANYTNNIPTDCLYVCTTAELCDILLLGYNIFTKHTLRFEDIDYFNFSHPSPEQGVLEKYSNIIFKNIETNTQHNPYDQEVREITSIRNGDIKQLEQSWQEDYIGTPGIIGNNLLRNYKNIAIILVTLASRAAMDSGLHPEIGYSLSDSYILKIEEVSDPSEAIHLGRKAEYHYTTLVHNLKKQKHVPKVSNNHYINQCKDYIFAHLHEKIQLTDIARHLYLNPNYLSNLFKREEGVLLTDYIMREKIQLAKNMLTYSQYSLNDISAYLGFCSQSHLGKHFKHHTGMTLQEYRTTYGIVEFRS